MNLLIKFTVVGLLAALIHLTILHWLVESYRIPPLFANVMAFMGAFCSSYFGQSLWTFNHRQHNHRIVVIRFLVVQLLCSFALNQSIYTLVLKYTQLDYLMASIPVLAVVAMATFALSIYWAFR